VKGRIVVCLLALAAAAAVATASFALSRAAATSCRAPQPNKALRVLHLTTTYKCSVAGVVVRQVLSAHGCGLSYNQGFTVSTCQPRITGRSWLCVSIAHVNNARPKMSYFDVGCAAKTLYASTQFDLRGPPA
jgi:hypothetical protein